MRLMSFTIGQQPNQATMIASKFPKGGVGGFLDNLNRWRTQVNLQPIEDPRQQPSEMIRVGPYEGTLYEMAGPQHKQYVVWADLGEESWFFRIQGQAAVVTEQRQNLEQFVQSLQFEDETR
jgi:hypothetical protein